MEREEDRRAKLENDAATKQLRLAMETDEERKARLERCGPGDRGRKKSKKEWI